MLGFRGRGVENAKMNNGRAFQNRAKIIFSKGPREIEATSPKPARERRDKNSAADIRPKFERDVHGTQARAPKKKVVGQIARMTGAAGGESTER